jgi:hypothetical protein
MAIELSLGPDILPQYPPLRLLPQGTPAVQRLPAGEPRTVQISFVPEDALGMVSVITSVDRAAHQEYIAVLLEAATRLFTFACQYQLALCDDIPEGVA